MTAPPAVVRVPHQGRLGPLGDRGVGERHVGIPLPRVQGRGRGEGLCRRGDRAAEALHCVDELQLHALDPRDAKLRRSGPGLAELFDVGAAEELRQRLLLHRQDRQELRPRDLVLRVQREQLGGVDGRRHRLDELALEVVAGNAASWSVSIRTFTADFRSLACRLTSSLTNPIWSTRTLRGRPRPRRLFDRGSHRIASG